mgnify:FL=1
MYRKQRLIHTLLLIAVGAGALAASLLLRPEVPSILPWVCFAVYLLATLLGCFSYELALWHNLWHNAWHARSADDDEPSDFAVYAGRVSAYLVMIVALCLTLFA